MNEGLKQTLENYRRLGERIVGFFRGLTGEQIALGAVLAAVAYYVITFSIYTILLQEVFYTQAFDSGIDGQGIWLLSRFLNPFVTVRGMNLFADSVTLYHLFIAPFYWLWNSINVLYFVQAVFIALGAVPLFLLAKDRLKSPFLAAALAFSYLLYPALQNLNLDQYHSEAITVFFLLTAFYFLHKEKYPWYYLFLILTLFGKDEVAATGLFIGLYLLLFKRQRGPGWTTIGLSLGWYFLCSRFFSPLLNGIGVLAAQPITYSHWFQGLMQNVFNPAFYLANIFHPESLLYYLGLLAPVGFIPVLSWPALFMLVPSVAVNVLSGTGYLRSIYYHYNYVQTAVIFWGLIEGLKLLNEKSVWLRPLILGAVVMIFALIFNLTLSQFPLNRQWGLIGEKIKQLSSEEVKAKQAAVKLVPAGAKVSASYSLLPHLCLRPEIYMFTNPFAMNLWDQWFQEGLGEPPAEGHVDYIVLDHGNLDAEEWMIVNYLQTAGYFGKIYDNSPALVLKKSAERPVAAGQGAQFVLYEYNKPVTVFDDFGSRLKLAGSGRVSSLYFPPSKYYLRTLMGETLPAKRPLALEIFGYFFVPADGLYGIELQSDGPSLLLIDGLVSNQVRLLTAGFHPYRLKYLNNGQRFDLRLKLKPVSGPAYIIPDQHLRLSYKPAEFAAYLERTRREQREQAARLADQPNKVINGGFEAVLGNFPKAWQLECWQENNAFCNYQVDKSERRQGRYSVKIYHQGKADSRWVQEVGLQPGAEFRLSGWIRTKDVSRAGTGAFIQVEGIGLRTEPIYETHGWTYVEATGKAPADRTRGKAECRLGDYGAPTTGTAYFDEIKLIKIEK